MQIALEAAPVSASDSLSDSEIRCDENFNLTPKAPFLVAINRLFYMQNSRCFL